MSGFCSTPPFFYVRMFYGTCYNFILHDVGCCKLKSEKLSGISNGQGRLEKPSCTIQLGILSAAVVGTS